MEAAELFHDAFNNANENYENWLKSAKTEISGVRTVRSAFNNKTYVLVRSEMWQDLQKKAGFAAERL